MYRSFIIRMCMILQYGRFFLYEVSFSSSAPATNKNACGATPSIWRF